MAAPKTPLLTVDCIILDAKGRILLIERKNPPFQGLPALPGGFVDIGETVEDACRREVLEEVGIKVRKLRLVGVYSAPDRDPRGHTCSVAFLAHVGRVSPKAGDDAAAAFWALDWRKLKFAFDHKTIIKDAMKLDGAPR